MNIVMKMATMAAVALVACTPTDPSQESYPSTRSMEDWAEDYFPEVSDFFSTVELATDAMTSQPSVNETMSACEDWIYDLEREARGVRRAASASPDPDVEARLNRIVNGTIASFEACAEGDFTTAADKAYSVSNDLDRLSEQLEEYR